MAVTEYNGIMFLPDIATFPPQNFVTNELTHVTQTKILTFGSLGIQYPIIYFGDTITLEQRDSLLVPIGNLKVPSNPYSLQDGYKYDFYIREKRFIIDDGTDRTIIEDIQTWGDLDILFNIYQSHQFRMIITGSLQKLEFFIIGERVGFIFPYIKMSYMWGQFDAYLDSLFKWRLDYGDIFSEYINESKHINIAHDIIDIRKTIITDVSRIIYSMNYPLVIDMYKELFGEKVVIAVESIIDNIAQYILLAIVTKLLYPHLLPIQNKDEHYNNLPVYEPWMILYILEFLNNFPKPDNNGEIPHNPGDDEGNNPYVFGLSPNWG